MSYEIYYDRAFVRVGDKFIPLVNSGSNNCFTTGLYGRDLCEKYWNVLNWHRRGHFIFPESEIREIAREYDQYNQESEIMFKSRNRRFEPGEMERWIINGMRHAYTVEEYVSFGNNFYVLDYSAPEVGKHKTYPFKTTDELLNILAELKGVESLELKLGYSRSVYRPKVGREPKKKLDTANLPEYYVLKGEYEGNAIYFGKFVWRSRFAFGYSHPSAYSKSFKTEIDALRYLEKHRDRLAVPYKFTPEKIVKPA